jgi:hypothetical protein
MKDEPTITLQPEMLRAGYERWLQGKRRANALPWLDQRTEMPFSLVPPRTARRRKPSAKRAIKDVTDAGLPIRAITITSAAITVHIGNGIGNDANGDENVSPLEQWRARRARKA